jgi:6-pyruvoyltetrahydropterin/6-carboxytetrahydropterin synthase
MAHALYGHNGPCKNIHGHTYHLEVTVLGAPLHKTGDSSDGMVMDFTDLKTIVEREIITHFDHALVLNEDSPHKDLKSLKEQFEKLIFLPVQPTCENLLMFFKNKLQHFFNAHHQLIAVKLRETPKSYAEWRKEDN